MNYAIDLISMRLSIFYIISYLITTFLFQVNPNFAIDLVAEDPIVICEKRSVFSDGGGALGHPRVFINLVSGKNKARIKKKNAKLISMKINSS